MRLVGVSTPEIRKDNTYIIHGQTANAQTNPITQKHIKNILKNIMIMDKAGIAHGDIEKGHVFYNNDGNVEFDCFRFNWSFKDAGRVNWEFPEFCYPTNLKQFEGNCLGDYISQINSDNNQNKFIQMYLILCSDLHSKKADFLEQTKLGTQEQIEYEQLQAEMFQNPDDNTIKLFKNKINLMYASRLAFTEWDEGNGACGHKIDDTRTTNAVKMYLSIISDTLEYIKQIEESEQSSCKNKLKYLDYEKRYAQDMLTKTMDSTVGMANWTINPYNPNNISHKNISSDKMNEFQQKTNEFKNIKPNDKQIIDKLLKLKRMYSGILEQ